MPEINHFVSVLASVGGCWQDGKCQSSWTWMFWIWFATDDHSATVSSPELDVEADQYKWFTMLWIHGRTSAQPFLFATASSFLHTPTKSYWLNQQLFQCSTTRSGCQRHGMDCPMVPNVISQCLWIWSLGNIIKTTEPIWTKFCTVIKTTKNNRGWFRACVQQIQDGGRPPYWKYYIFNNSTTVQPT